MASISSLLRSAAAARKKVRAYEDQLAAFEWENSAQTTEDFMQYQGYLENQSGKTTDPSDLLTYQGKIRSARRSYISNELQREQIKIMEGNATTQDKMNAVQDLFQLAVDNGDLNTAQNLMSQWDALSIKLQNEQETAARAFATSSKKVKNDLLKKLEKGVDDVTLPNGQTVTPLAELTRNFQQTGDTVGVTKAAAETLEAIRNVVIDQYNNAASQEEVDKLEEKYGPGLADLDRDLKVDIGGQKLSLQDVVNAEANESINNPIYSLQAIRNESTGVNEFKLKKNNVATFDYVRQFDEQGNEYFVPASVRTDQESLFFGSSDQGRGLSTQITDAGEVIGGGSKTGMIRAGEAEVERRPDQSIGERLKRMGIIATQNGTTLNIKLPGESVQRQATIQPDGSIRYYGDEGELIEIGLVDRNLGTDSAPMLAPAGTPRVVSPEEVSDFGRASAFGGKLSQTSAQGRRYLEDITGQTMAQRLDTGPLKGPVRVGNDFSGFGTAVTSNLLQSAGATRQQIQLQQQKAAMLQAQTEAAARLQASQTFNLNQVPVQQLTSQGVLKRQLQVAAPTAQPRVVVAPPAPAGKITSVGVAQPTRRVTNVGVSSGSQRRVTVR